MEFWVRERKLRNGQWTPDMDEAMCIEGIKKEATVLLEDYEDDPNYRVREYVRKPRGGQR